MADIINYTTGVINIPGSELTTYKLFDQEWEGDPSYYYELVMSKFHKLSARKYSKQIYQVNENSERYLAPQPYQYDIYFKIFQLTKLKLGSDGSYKRYFVSRSVLASMFNSVLYSVSQNQYSTMYNQHVVLDAAPDWLAPYFELRPSDLQSFNADNFNSGIFTIGATDNAQKTVAIDGHGITVQNMTYPDTRFDYHSVAKRNSIFYLQPVDYYYGGSSASNIRVNAGTMDLTGRATSFAFKYSCPNFKDEAGIDPVDSEAISVWRLNEPIITFYDASTSESTVSTSNLDPSSLGCLMYIGASPLTATPWDESGDET